MDHFKEYHIFNFFFPFFLQITKKNWVWENFHWRHFYSIFDSASFELYMGAVMSIEKFYHLKGFLDYVNISYLKFYQCYNVHIYTIICRIWSRKVSSMIIFRIQYFLSFWQINNFKKLNFLMLLKLEILDSACFL